jgi:hypothetical protein
MRVETTVRRAGACPDRHGAATADPPQEDGFRIGNIASVAFLLTTEPPARLTRAAHVSAIPAAES